MNIELNGVVYSKEQIQSGVNKYITYLEGLNRGLYGTDEGEVALLELTENKSIESVINKLQNFQQVDDISSFDFNSSGTTDVNDINLLKNIIDKGTEKQSELQIVDKGATKEIITSGGYKIVTNSNAQDTKIYYPNGSLMTHIHGDPHVDEYNNAGQKVGGWHYADDSMFILPDGTEMVMNSTTWGGNQNIMVNRGIYIKDGDKVAAFGLEFGDGRNNAAVDAEEGSTMALRFLDVDASEWDAAVADTNNSNKRNGVYAFVNGGWARRDNDGEFYDLKNESWGDYTSRQGNELFTDGEALKVNREQLIAALDGKDVLTYDAIQGLDLGDFETTVVNKFLENKSSFGTRLIAQLGLLKEFGVGTEDLMAVIDGGVTSRQGSFLNNISDFFSQFDSSREINSSVKDALLDKYFSLNRNVEREPKSENPELVDFVVDVINTKLSENNMFSGYLSQVFENSIFAQGEINLEEVKKQQFFLEKMDSQAQFIFNNELVSSSINDLLASKYFNVDQENINAAKEILSENQERHVEIMQQTLNATENLEHSYKNQFKKLFEKIFSPSLARTIMEDNFRASSSRGSGGSGFVSRTRGSGSSTSSSLITIINNFINSPEASFSEFSQKASLILNYRDESGGDTEAVTANKQITESIATIKLDSLRAELEGLQAQLDSISGSNSRYAVRNRRNLNRKVSSVSSQISNILSSLSA